MKDLDIYDLLALLDLGHDNQFWNKVEAAKKRPVKDVTEEYMEELDKNERNS